MEAIEFLDAAIEQATPQDPHAFVAWSDLVNWGDDVIGELVEIQGIFPDAIEAFSEVVTEDENFHNAYGALMRAIRILKDMRRQLQIAGVRKES